MAEAAPSEEVYLYLVELLEQFSVKLGGMSAKNAVATLRVLLSRDPVEPSIKAALQTVARGRIELDRDPALPVASFATEHNNDYEAALEQLCRYCVESFLLAQQQQHELVDVLTSGTVDDRLEFAASILAYWHHELVKDAGDVFIQAHANQHVPHPPTDPNVFRRPEVVAMLRAVANYRKHDVKLDCGRIKTANSGILSEDAQFRDTVLEAAKLQAGDKLPVTYDVVGKLFNILRVRRPNLDLLRAVELFLGPSWPGSDRAPSAGDDQQPEPKRARATTVDDIVAEEAAKIERGELADIHRQLKDLGALGLSMARVMVALQACIQGRIIHNFCGQLVDTDKTPLATPQMNEAADICYEMAQGNMGSHIYKDNITNVANQAIATAIQNGTLAVPQPAPLPAMQPYHLAAPAMHVAPYQGHQGGGRGRGRGGHRYRGNRGSGRGNQQEEEQQEENEAPARAARSNTFNVTQFRRA